ncbi:MULTISPECIES: WbqC family protein [Flavobacterium]|uniref:WbqC family protein n=1 Tax=Flavobacterium TaxID=237 RepID=UPI001FCC1A23|nr:MULTISPECIES: WbqC family protein [Flavobacterium]UOK43778.1 WbqC family protein [Flavobacterium enshiense]
MHLAIMQPYLFPYIGYFQLINAVDKFVMYDDVNFIKQGWINRNRVMVQGQPFMFTVPLINQSSFLKINEICINHNLYSIWKNKFLITLEQSYKKAPFFMQTYELVLSVLNKDVLGKSIASLSLDSIVKVSEYIGVDVEFVTTSSVYNNDDLKAKNRVLDICYKEQARHYVNVSGGMQLYDKGDFKSNGVELSFIKSLPIEYPQFKNEFLPWLSIIDVMMFNSPEEIKFMLEKHELI